MAKWFLAELIKGEHYPDKVIWPVGMDAYIPLSDSVLSAPAVFPDRNRVKLLWKKPDSDELHPMIWDDVQGRQECAVDVPRWVEGLKNESYRSEHTKPITAMLPFHYHQIPGSVRYILGAIMIKFRSGVNRNVFPMSYLNCGCELLLEICNARWDSGVKLPALVLTHDIDSGEGFDWVRKIAHTEERFGFRSSWNVVPKKYKVRRDILHGLLGSGHEIGLHGLWHNNKEAFLPIEQMRLEFSNLRDFMSEFSIKGYRAPSWFRTKNLFQVLSEFLSYDLSCLDNDLTSAGNGGVGFMRPFRMESGLIELPCTVPFESPLAEGISPEALVDYWMPKIEFIKKSEGMLLVNTHPDPYYSGNERLLKVYEYFLHFLEKGGWTAMLPRDVVTKFN